MKKLFLILTIIIIVIITSCNDDVDNITTDYCGKWKTEKPIATSTGYMSVMYYLEMNGNLFKETFICPPRTYYTAASQLCLEGSVSCSGNILKLIVHQLSVSYYDRATETFSDPYETRTYTDQGFGFEHEGMFLSVGNYQAEYELQNDSLILKVDYNRDSLFTDNEKYIYTRQ